MFGGSWRSTKGGVFLGMIMCDSPVSCCVPVTVLWLSFLLFVANVAATFLCVEVNNAANMKVSCPVDHYRLTDAFDLLGC